MGMSKCDGCPRRLSEAWGPMWVRTKGSCIDSQSVHPLGSLGAGIWARATGARGEGRVNGAWGQGGNDMRRSAVNDGATRGDGSTAILRFHLLSLSIPIYIYNEVLILILQ